MTTFKRAFNAELEKLAKDWGIPEDVKAQRAKALVAKGSERLRAAGRSALSAAKPDSNLPVYKNLGANAMSPRLQAYSSSKLEDIAGKKRGSPLIGPAAGKALQSARNTAASAIPSGARTRKALAGLSGLKVAQLIAAGGASRIGAW